MFGGVGANELLKACEWLNNLFFFVCEKKNRKKNYGFDEKVADALFVMPRVESI